MRATLLIVLAAWATGGCARRPVPEIVTPREPLRVPPPIEGEATAIRQIRAGVLRGLMMSGELTVTPDAETLAAATRDGTSILATVVRVCIDPSGTPIGVIARRSGVPAFDRAVLAVVAAWRFRPYLEAGAPAPVCSVARFQHRTEAPPPGPPPERLAAEALPEAEVELPASIEVRGALPVGLTDVAPAPGVLIARVCGRPGATDEAPRFTLLQSSGAPAFDRAAFERRATTRIGAPADARVACVLHAEILPSVDDSAAFTADPVPGSVAPAVLEHRRISGEANIFPSDDVKWDIRRSGEHVLMVPVKLCIDRAGRPTEVRVVRSSGHFGYDVDLINGVASWRYRPLLVDGRPTPVCSALQFIYRQR